jgi:hypothetical protein
MRNGFKTSANRSILGIVSDDHDVKNEQKGVVPCIDTEKEVNDKTLRCTRGRVTASFRGDPVDLGRNW